MTSIPRTLLREGLRTRWAAIVLVIVAWAIYRPAINRVFASDQIVYLAEREGRTSLVDGLRLYDYNATRRYWKGDEALFRPVLFAWLAVGTSLFSYHHVAWNVANVALHVLVALSLFQLLMTIRPSAFALPAAVLFLVLKPPIELVLWNHLGGYLLACIFLTVGLRALVRLTAQPESHRSVRDRTIYVLAFTAASLCHEAMVPASALAAVYLVGMHWWMASSVGSGFSRISPSVGSGFSRTILSVAAAPLVLFGGLYAIHLRHVARIAYVDRQDVQGLFRADTVMRAFPRTAYLMGRWMLELALPSAVTISNAAFTRFAKAFALSWTSPLHLVNALVALAAVALLAWSTSRKQLARTWPLLALMVGAAFAYGGILSFGRPPEELISVTYYPYIFSVLFAVFTYALVDFTRLQSWRAAAGWIVVIGLATLHATGSANTAREVERQNHYPSLYFNRVIAFVDAHKAEPDFSFRIDPHPESLDPSVYLIEGYPTDPTATSSHRLTQILFRRYYDDVRPQYVLDSDATRARLPPRVTR